MRVDTLNQIAQTYGVNGKLRTNSVSKVNSADKVEISLFGKELQIAREALAKTPDVREEKIAVLKEQIESGKYNVSGESFAEKLLAKYEEV